MVVTYGSCRVSDQGTTLRASDLHNARATILNPFNNINRYRTEAKYYQGPMLLKWNTFNPIMDKYLHSL